MQTSDIVEKPAFSVVGLQYRGTNENDEIAQMWNDLVPRIREIEFAAPSMVSYGIITEFDNSTNEMEYVAGVEAEDVSDVPEGMVHVEVPAQTYAVFSTTLPALHDTITQIYDEWLPDSDYERADGPEFELYDENFDPNDEDSELYLYVPIE